MQDGGGKELAPVGTSRTGARRTFRVRLTGRIRAALPRKGGFWRLRLFCADVLQALREAVSIDPTAFHKFANVVLRDADGAPARSEPNVRQSPFGAEEVNQGLGAPESFGRFSNREELHGWRLPEASSRAEGEAEFAAFRSRRPAFNLRKQHRSSRHKSPLKSPVSILNTSPFSFPHQEQVPGPTPLNVTLTMTGLVSLELRGRSGQPLRPSGRRVTGLITSFPGIKSFPGNHPSPRPTLSSGSSSSGSSSPGGIMRRSRSAASKPWLPPCNSLWTRASRNSSF